MKSFLSLPQLLLQSRALAFLVHEPGARACEALRLPQHECEHDQAEDLDCEATDGNPEEQGVIAQV